MSRGLLVLCLLGSGCRKIDAAPEELDDLLHFLWEQVAAGDEEALAEGVRNLDAAVKAAKLEDPEDGTLEPLTKAQAALVGVIDRDPRDAPGVYLVNRYACELPMLEEILTFAQQDLIYPGVYDAYGRDYLGSKADYLGGVTDTLDWDLEYTASILGATYVARPTGMLIRVPEVDEVATPWGPIVFARTFMSQPAAFESENKSQEQDYQLEIYWERDKGEIVHVYGLWRQADFGSGFTSDDKGVQRIVLNNLIDWDDTTEELCATGLP